jgi:hypothetical protein
MKEKMKYFHDIEFFDFVFLIIEDPFRQKEAPEEVCAISRRSAEVQLQFLLVAHRDPIRWARPNVSPQWL